MKTSAAIRKCFPFFGNGGEAPVYLDNGATTHKPLQVIEAVNHFYRNANSNIHRGVHKLSMAATEAHEAVRAKLCRFIHAESAEEIIFTSGTTDGINMLAGILEQGGLFKGGGSIAISAMEHHSNLVPWQMSCRRTGARLKVMPVDDNGELNMNKARAALGDDVRLMALTHVSNTLGTVNPVKELINMAHECGALTLIDGAQSVAHFPVDVRDLDADFYVFSAHKMYGPTGVGVLYGKKALLVDLPPVRGGGDMIDRVTFEETTYNKLPHKFEAGTPNIAGVAGFGAAVDFINELGWEWITAQEERLLDYALNALKTIDGLRLVGSPAHRSGVISFLLGEAHPYDTGVILDQMGVAVRTGHHCTQPLMARFGIPGTVRASYAVYNTNEDTDALVQGLERVKKMLLN